MKRLWTPWRYKYVTEVIKQKGCFLCEKSQKRRDEENLILHRDEKAFALLNLYPYNTGHVMVAPYDHIGEMENLDAGASSAMWQLTQRVVQVLKKEYQPDGFNIGLNLGMAAGAGLADHLHIHIVPRWERDTNYMAVVGDTKVLPETLDRTYQRLRPYFHG